MFSDLQPCVGKVTKRHENQIFWMTYRSRCWQTFYAGMELDLTQRLFGDEPLRARLWPDDGQTMARWHDGQQTMAQNWLFRIGLISSDLKASIPHHPSMLQCSPFYGIKAQHVYLMSGKMYQFLEIYKRYLSSVISSVILQESSILLAPTGAFQSV